MALTKVTGQVINSTTDLSVGVATVGGGTSTGDLYVVGVSTFSGDVAVGGTLTYEDVTNVDAVGLITARKGITVTANGLYVNAGISTFNADVKVGSGITLSTDGDIFATGVCTATSFVGALPISNESNDRVLTSSGSGAINAEANLSMTGNILTFNTTANSHRIKNIATGNHYTVLEFDSNRSSAGDELAYIDFKWDGDKVADIQVLAGSDTTNKDDGHLVFRTSASQGSISEALRIDSAGRIGISTSNPQVLLDIVETPVANSDRNGDDKLTIEHAGTTNINLISAADNSGFLLFSDDTRAQGYVKYDHSTDDLCVSASDDFWVRTNGTETFRVVGSNGFAQLCGASDVRLALGSTGTAGTNDSNWVRGEGANFLSNAASGYHKWEIGGAERMHLDTNGNLFLRSSTAGARYVVLNNSGDSDTHTLSNNMNWIRGNGDNLQLNCADGGFIAFETNGTERCRIHDSAYMSFGTTAVYPRNGGTTLEGAYGHLILSRSGTGGETAVRFERDNATRGSIVTSTSTAYNTTSDYRLKENVTDLTDAITRLKKITPRRFSWIDDENKQLVDGFIAHEVSESVPEAVRGTKDQVATADDVVAKNATTVGDPIHQQVDYSKYVPLLTAALQEAITEIETLKTKVAALESS